MSSPSFKPAPGPTSYGRPMSIHPTLRYTDTSAAISFLTGTLGFTEGMVSIADDGTVGHAVLGFGGGTVLLGTRRAGDDDRFDTGRAVTYLALDDAAAVDAHHDGAVAAGAPVVMELVDQPYGSREYAVADPEGNIWSIGSYHPSA